MQTKRFSIGLGLACLVAAVFPLHASTTNPDWQGRWALTRVGGGAGWLEVTQQDGYLDGKILWRWGSVTAVSSVTLDGDLLWVTRVRQVERKDTAGNVVRTQQLTETWRLEADGEQVRGEYLSPQPDGSAVVREAFSAVRIPELPPRPDLSTLRFGEAVDLLAGNSLEGWELTDPQSVNGWSVTEHGVLVNDPVQTEGEPRIHYGNLRTVAEFEDFSLSFEVRVPEKGNSGVYLRGVYEVQVLDSAHRDASALNMGAIYSRIAPATRAERPAGTWQQMDIMLVDRHVTVRLNGTVVIDNQALTGITGGALWADELRPGPIYLQGDHTGVEYRNLQLRPVLDQ